MKLKYFLQAIFICVLSLYLIGCENQQHTNSEKEIFTMRKRVINPWTWQDKFGFVQGNEVTNANRTLFTAGIVSVDKDGNLLYPNDMEQQINQIFNNMEILLKQSNFQLSDVVRFTYYTTDVQAFIRAGAVLDKRLKTGNCKPATSLIGVNALFHPNCIIEIEALVVD